MYNPDTAILMSIQSKWCELIANGKKTVEIRKTIPKLDTPFKVYMYCTKAKDRFVHKGITYYSDALYVNRCTKLPTCGCSQYEKNLNGKIIGEFVCDEIDVFGDILTGVSTSWLLKNSQLSCVELGRYAGNAEHLYAWHISNLKIYVEPKLLHHFFKPCGNCDKKGTIRCTEELTECNAKVITRPPQSWCYVKENSYE